MTIAAIDSAAALPAFAARLQACRFSIFAAGENGRGDKAASELVELTNVAEAVQDGWILIERINTPFLAAGGNGDDFRAGLERAVALGWRGAMNPERS